MRCYSSLDPAAREEMVTMPPYHFHLSAIKCVQSSSLSNGFFLFALCFSIKTWNTVFITVT